MLAAAIAMVRAWGHAAALGADLFFRATSRAVLLAGSPSAQSAQSVDRNGRKSGSEERSTVCAGGDLPGEEIKPVLIHRQP